MAALILISLSLIAQSAHAAVATTTLRISICGNSVIDSGELCDQGATGLGEYSSTTAGRQCVPSCDAYGPYCGDGTLQALYGEQCDDGNAVNGDLCSNLCVQESPPVSTTTPPAPPPPAGGGGGGGGAFTGNVPVRAQTRVILQGKAYPNASVNILNNGKLVSVVQADGSANFSYETTEVTPGPTTFGFWAIDQQGARSITFTTTFQITQNAVTTVSNIYLPPTVGVRSKKIAAGSLLDVFGATVPGAQVSIYIDRENFPRMTSTSTSAGLWSAPVPVDGLANEAFHVVRAIFELFGPPSQAKSGFSQAVNFYLGQEDRQASGEGDLNGDGKVNLIDFSLFLFHWGTDHAIADLNLDGRVNLADFSILLANWTG